MTLAEIEAILGDPEIVTRFAVPNDGEGFFDLSRPNLSGPPLAQWSCYPRERRAMKFPCSAVQEESSGEWFMLSACPKHAWRLRKVPFRDIDYFLPKGPIAGGKRRGAL